MKASYFFQTILMLQNLSFVTYFVVRLKAHTWFQLWGVSFCWLTLSFCHRHQGLEEETGVYERASNKNIYLRVAVNTITRLRSEAKESVPGSSKSQPGQPSVTQSHQATLGGSRAAKTSFTLHRSTGSGKKVEVVLTRKSQFVFFLNDRKRVTAWMDALWRRHSLSMY